MQRNLLESRHLTRVSTCTDNLVKLSTKKCSDVVAVDHDETLHKLMRPERNFVPCEPLRKSLRHTPKATEITQKTS